MLRRKRAAKAVEAAGGQDPRGEKRGGQLGKETRSLEEAVFGLVEAADVLVSAPADQQLFCVFPLRWPSHSPLYTPSGQSAAGVYIST